MIHSPRMHSTFCCHGIPHLISCWQIMALRLVNHIIIIISLTIIIMATFIIWLWFQVSLQVTLPTALFIIWNKSSRNLFSIFMEITLFINGTVTKTFFLISRSALFKNGINYILRWVFFLWMELHEAVFQLSTILLDYII